MSDDLLKPVDVTGANLEEAISNGLTQLGLTRNDVIIEILEEGGAGFFGMGAKDAVVRLVPLKIPSPPVTVASPVQPVEEPDPEPITDPEVVEAILEPVEEQVEEMVSESEDAPEPVVEDEEPESESAVEQSPRVVRQAADIDYKHEAEIAKATLEELLDQMGVETTIEMFPADPSRQGDDTDVPWVLNILGKDLGILIGRRGETLNALQFITRLIVSRELQQRSSFVIDVEGYKTRREDTLRSLAKRMASRAASEERTMTLEPMPPNERRIIHLALRGDRAVRTESIGSGDRRKVTIIPEKLKK